MSQDPELPLIGVKRPVGSFDYGEAIGLGHLAHLHLHCQNTSPLDVLIVVRPGEQFYTDPLRQRAHLAINGGCHARVTAIPGRAGKAGPGNSLHPPRPRSSEILCRWLAAQKPDVEHGKRSNHQAPENQHNQRG
jgi:hypothetical protein